MINKAKQGDDFRVHVDTRNTEKHNEQSSTAHCAFFCAKLPIVLLKNVLLFLFFAEVSGIKACQPACYKCGRNIKATCVAVNIEDFSTKIETVN